jgi:hypothetical protein
MPDIKVPPPGLLQFYEASLDFGRKTQAEYSKWLINTLYLLHSGSIAGVIYRAPSDKLVQFIVPLSWFVAGVALGFLAGLATWTNYHWFNIAYSDMIKLVRRSEWQDGVLPNSVKYVAITQWLALGVGLLSFVCLIVGACSTLKILASMQ